jgi:hypothetical protein
MPVQNAGELIELQVNTSTVVPSCAPFLEEEEEENARCSWEARSPVCDVMCVSSHEKMNPSCAKVDVLNAEKGQRPTSKNCAKGTYDECKKGSTEML